MFKKIVIYLLSAIILIGALNLIERLVVPKYMSGIVEGSLIESYYDEDKRNDVMFIGDCEVYENFSPITLWESYGITSYIRGSAQQLIWQSYYLLEDTLKYEKPEVVVFNVLSMKYNEPQKEAYNRMSIDGMKWSSSKIGAIKASMLPDESFIDYLFPLLRYHSRWDELTSEDFKYMFNKDDLFHNGYYMRADVRPMEQVREGRPLGNYSFGDTAYEYLDKMVELCKNNDIKLILIKAPTYYPYWYPEWDQQMKEYAELNQVDYINFLDLVDEVGLDFNEDTYDAGLHLNVYGAEKMSAYFGAYLEENYGLEGHRGDESYENIWTDKVDYYYDMRASQINDIALYGEIRTYKSEEQLKEE